MSDTNSNSKNQQEPAVAEKPNDLQASGENETKETTSSTRRMLLGLSLGIGAICLPMLMVFLFIYRQTIAETKDFSEPADIVECVAFSPSGDLLAAAGHDKKIYIWDLRSMALVGTLRGHTQTINCLAFSPDGSRIIAGDWFTARLWDVESGKQILWINTPTNFIQAVAFAPDGKHVVTCSGSKTDPIIRLWDVNTPDETEFATGLVGLCGLPFAQSALALANKTSIRRIGLRRQVRRFVGHAKPANCVAFLDKGKRLLSAGDETVRLWDVETGEELHSFQGSKRIIKCLAASPDEKRFAFSGNDTIIHLWDIDKGKEIAKLEGHKSTVMCLAFSPDGKYLVSGSLGNKRAEIEEQSAMPEEKRTLRIWDAEIGYECYHIETGGEGVLGADFSPDGKYFASGGIDKKVRLWRLP